MRTCAEPRHGEVAAGAEAGQATEPLDLVLPEQPSAVEAASRGVRTGGDARNRSYLDGRITGALIRPGRTGIVHHVILYEAWESIVCALESIGAVDRFLCSPRA